MKKMLGSIISAPNNTVAALCALLALAAPLQTRAEVDVCEGNGYRLEIGDGFQVRRKNGEICSYRAGEAAVVLLKDWPGLSREAIEDFVDKGYQVDDIALTRHGELQQISTVGGAGYLAKVAGIVKNKVVEGLAGGFVGDNGQGIAVLISSVADKWADFENQANAIIESIEFTEVEQLVGALEWRQMLSGTGLSYRMYSDRADVRKNYYFCSDGRFYSSKRESEHAAGDGNTMFGFSSSNDSGDWDIRTVQGRTQLVLYYGDGHENWANIEDRDGETWVDGTRYYMIENSRCR